MKPPLPVPPPDLQPAPPSMTATMTITWPEGHSVTGVIRASRASQDAKIEWTGTISMLNGTEPLVTDFNLLQDYLKREAKRTGGKLKVSCNGHWILMDEVV